MTKNILFNKNMPVLKEGREVKYSSKKGIVLSLRATMPLKKNDRALELSNHTSRVVNNGEIHEFLVANDYLSNQEGQYNNISYIGFFQFDEGGLIEVGDPLIDSQGNTVGEIIGFDYTHLTDGTQNHMNIVLQSSDSKSGTERGYEAEQKFTIPGYDIETIQKKERMTVAQAIFEILNSIGVSHIFGYPGETSFSYYSNLSHFKGTHHVGSDETVATHMADAYARLTNTIGVVDVPKVGAPLATLPLMEAKNSSIPLLLLTTGTNMANDGMHPTAEYDQLLLMKPVTKEQFSLRNPQQLITIFKKAIRIALSGNPSPVAIEIPSNILKEKIDLPHFDELHQEIHCPLERPIANDASIEKAINLLRTVKNPVILAGGGVHQSQAYQSLLSFASILNIPVATTINGKGAFDETHALSVGVVGAKGDVYSNSVMENADTVFVIGSKLGDKSTKSYKMLKGKNIIHLDINPEEINHVLPSDIGLVGDIDATLNTINKNLLGQEELQELFQFQNQTEVLAELRQKRGEMYQEYELPHMPISPSLLCKLLDQKFEGDEVVVADGSTASGWSSVFMKTKGGIRANIQPRGSGMIGYGLPALLGATVADTKRPLIGIGGDGGFKPTVHAIETAVMEKMDMTYFVLDDKRLTFMTEILEEVYGHNPLSLTPPSTDLSLVAKGFGANSVVLRTNQELIDFLNGHDFKGVNIVVLEINPEIRSPDLIMSLKKNKNNF